MGHKTHPIGFRLGIIKGWKSEVMPPEREFGRILHEDLKIREIIKRRFFQAGIENIILRRIDNRMEVEIHAARPGLIIGRKGAGMERIKNIVKQIANIPDENININPVEVKNPDLSAQLIAENIAIQMERRIPHRQAMKRAIASAMRAGAKGIKIQCSGRLGGVELARTEWMREGRLPLQTIRADIDYGEAVSKTKWGTNGVKVWIFKGEILKGNVVK